MGRELRRKQAKKDGKSLEKDEIIEEHHIKRYLIIIGILVIVMVLIYLLSAVFITKEVDWFNPKSNTTNDASAVSNSILASTIFKQSEDEYYVYFYDFNEKEGNITNIVDSTLTTDKVYKVDTSSALNANYVAKESNKNAKTLNDLKVKAPTLIKISNDTITEYYEGNEIVSKIG